MTGTQNNSRETPGEGAPVGDDAQRWATAPPGCSPGDVEYTIFADATAQSCTRHTAQWDRLFAEIERPREYATKQNMPLIKLARVGDLRSERNSLCHAANLTLVYGVECDYDGERVPIDEAQRRAQDAGVEALFYTSASHTPQRPRWRALFRLSQPCEPAQRSRFVAIANEMLGGVLARESFNVSQRFYIGKVAGSNYVALRSHGRCVDEFELLYDGVYPVSSADGSDGKLTHASALRTSFNSAHTVAEILARHPDRYTRKGRRWVPTDSKHPPGIRPIPGKTELCRCDHSNDVLFGTFDAWIAFVELDHGGDMHAAEAAFRPQHEAELVAGFGEAVALSAADVTKAELAFTRKKSGEIEPTKNNVVTALAHPEVCGYCLGYDEFLGKIMRAPLGTDEWTPLADTDYMEIALRLERVEGGFRSGFGSISKELMRDAVAYVASVNAFDSAKDWLNALPPHDGRARVETSIIAYFGAQDSAYVRAIGRYLWTALAGRTLQPGIKADMVPVATGAQGMRKSSTVAAIPVSRDFFTTVDLSRKDDDSARLMAGKQVGELDELRGLGTREAEAIKSFITRGFEEWVPKYYEMVRRYQRRIVFIGTSNQDDFLSDATGNRRWLPFRCGMCDPDALARDRDQLWAEARDLFLQHGVMYEEAERLAQAEHADFTEHDDWEPLIEGWLRTPDFNGGTIGDDTPLTTAAALHFIGVPPAQQNRLHQSRVKKIMKRFGFVEKSGRGGRRFVRPLGGATGT